MDSRHSDNTLNIQPLAPGGFSDWDQTPKPAANHQSAADARLRIDQLTRPSYQGSTPTQLSGVATAGTLRPNPVSPAEEELRKLPKLPSVPPHYSKAKPILSALASFLFILMLFKAPVLFSQLTYVLNNHANPTPTPAQNAVAEVVPPNPVITIPKINVNAPIVFPASTADAPNYDPELENGVVHFPNTALPGQTGNTVIFGHSSNDWWQPGNYKFVFVLLDKLVPGDTFSVNYNSKRYIYQITNSKIVEATDVSVLAPTPDPTITLITCWPAGTSLKREIIQAKQISPSQTSGTGTVTQTPNSNSITTLPSSAPNFLQQLQDFWKNVSDGLSNKPANVTAPNTSSQSGNTLPGAK